MQRFLRIRALHFFLFSGLAILGSTAQVRAAVTQPNGQAIPLTGRLEALLNGSAANNNINEMINAQRDAQVQPEKFSPLCDFSGRYVAKGGGANFAIGWYNVDDLRADTNPPRYVPMNLTTGLNVAAATSQVYILFPFSDALPAMNMLDLNSASIRAHQKYAGGLIGFVLVPNPNGTGNTKATQYHYTEKRFNTYCSMCATPGYWISTVIYKSNQLPNTFYLGFEDLDFVNASGAAGVNGNDLDYDDFLFRFSGVACLGAGQSCTDMTKQGACQIGVTDCDGQGNLFCKNLTQPGQNGEICDGLDNDCNGAVDEGATCPTNQICDRGRCSDRCGLDFPCPDGLSCDNGRCVDQPCVGMTCSATQICRQGSCVNPCTGIVCPSPSFCSAGTCIDACTDQVTGMPIVCKDKNGSPDPKKVCVNGACVGTCDCVPCSGSQACQASTGKCVEPSCAAITCGPGEQCRGGACVAACTGTSCPSGQVCYQGKCGKPCGDSCGIAATCRNNQCVSLCADIICEADQICEFGYCINPCEGVVCDRGYTCQGGMCVDGDLAVGCSCRLASGETQSSRLAIGTALLLLAWLLTRSRRRATTARP